jgi:heptosyltransferase-2
VNGLRRDQHRSFHTDMGRINRRRDRYLKRILEAILRPFLRRRQASMDEIRASAPRRILIVRQHNQMGDMLCAVPAFRAIREQFPQARTMLITAPVNHGVMEGNPFLDQILLFDKVRVRNSWGAIRSFWKELRAFDAELAIVLNSVSFSGTSAALARLSGARHLIGGDSVPFGWSFSRWLYDVEMPSQRFVSGHAIDHQLEPLAAIGILTADRSTVVRPSRAAMAQARAFLEGIGPGPWMALHPGAGKRENRWPAERFAAVAGALRARGASVYLIEGPADAEATHETQRAAVTALPVLANVRLNVVAAALKQSQFALVNDTGVMHVAGAVGVGALALFGPTPSSSWKPPSERVAAIQSESGLMEDISLESVLERLEELLPAAV